MGCLGASSVGFPGHQTLVTLSSPAGLQGTVVSTEADAVCVCVCVWSGCSCHVHYFAFKRSSKSKSPKALNEAKETAGESERETVRFSSCPPGRGAEPAQRPMDVC